MAILDINHSDTQSFAKWTTQRGEDYECLVEYFAEPENESVRECQDFCEQTMCVSEFANCQCEVPEQSGQSWSLEGGQAIIIIELWPFI